MYAIQNIFTQEFMVQYGRTGNITKPSDHSRTATDTYVTALFPDEKNARTQRTRVCRMNSGLHYDHVTRSYVDGTPSDEHDWAVVKVKVVVE